MDVHDRRVAEKEGKDRKTVEGALRQRRRVLEQFTEAVGKTRITDLKTEDLAHYVACLARLPISFNKCPADRALTLEQHMERGDDPPADAVGLSGSTVNRNLTFLSTLLNHAKKEGLHPAEPLDQGGEPHQFVAHADHLDQSCAQQIILFRGRLSGLHIAVEIAGFRLRYSPTLHPEPEENALLSRKISRIRVIQSELQKNY